VILFWEEKTNLRNGIMWVRGSGIKLSLGHELEMIARDINGNMLQAIENMSLDKDQTTM
jgi:hypothetical protein